MAKFESCNCQIQKELQKDSLKGQNTTSNYRSLLSKVENKSRQSGLELILRINLFFETLSNWWLVAKTDNTTEDVPNQDKLKTNNHKKFFLFVTDFILPNTSK